MAIAAVFLLVLAFVGDACSKSLRTAFSRVVAFGLFGGMFFPWLKGIMAEKPSE